MAPKENKQEFQQTQQHSKNKPLRICCYGSSSSRTQERYTSDAYHLGYTLVHRGHTCVNGAGKFGCMGALNRGAEDASFEVFSRKSEKGDDGHEELAGKVFGVIHEMFIQDETNGEGGGSSGSSSRSKNGHGSNSNWLDKCAPVFSTCKNAEIHIAGGNDLQERKRMLVDGADALIVMPGGPGTFDEVWEMACSKQIGIIKIPIVCVNIDGYYDPFHSILQRAYEDEFLYKHPDDILHFEPTSQKALEWIEKKIYEGKANGSSEEKISAASRRSINRRKSAMNRMMSVINVPFPLSQRTSWLESGNKSKNDENSDEERFVKYMATFAIGLTLGLVTATKKR